VKQPAELFQQPPLPQATIKAISPPVTAVAAPPPPPQSTFTPLSTTAAATIPTKKLVVSALTLAKSISFHLSGAKMQVQRNQNAPQTHPANTDLNSTNRIFRK